MTDLLDRLRKVDGSDEGTHWYRNPDGPEAAREIERLLAEIAAIKGQAEQATEYVLAQINKDLREENARLHDSINKAATDVWVAENRLSEAEALLRRGRQLCMICALDFDTDEQAVISDIDAWLARRSSK